MELSEFLGHMVDRHDCVVKLFVGITLNECDYLTSSDEDNIGVLGLIATYGDYKVVEYNVGEYTLNILVEDKDQEQFEIHFTTEPDVEEIEVETLGSMW